MNAPNTSHSRLMMDLAEQQVMAAVQADTPGAFEKLVELYQKRVFHFILQLVGRREEAEDLTQDLFMKVFRTRKSYRPESRLSTWIFTIAHNLALNHLRSRHRSKTNLPKGLTGAGSTTHLLQPELNAVSPEGTPSAQMRTVELSQVVQEAIQTLGEDQRVAIVLNKFEEMSYEEIAQVMGRNVGAVKSLLVRARLNLKDQLEDYLSQGIRPSARPGHPHVEPRG